MYYIPDIKLVGYGRSQTYQVVCLSCKQLFFNFNEDRDEYDLFCGDCPLKEKKIQERHVSPVKYIGNIIGWVLKSTASGQRSRYNYRKVYERDHFTCRYCEYSPYTSDEFRPLHIDHIIPFVTGGSNRMENLVVACGKCNQKVNDKWFQNFSEKKDFILKARNLRAN